MSQSQKRRRASMVVPVSESRLAKLFPSPALRQKDGMPFPLIASSRKRVIHTCVSHGAYTKWPGANPFTMVAAFYMHSPTSNSPYRQLIIVAHEGGWRVRLSGGTRWRPKHSEELKVIPAKSFAD